MYFWYDPLLYLQKNMTKMSQRLISFSTPPCQPRLQGKIKTIEHSTTCDILIISCNYNRSHSLVCLKTWGKGPKRLKIPKNNHFLISFCDPLCRLWSQSKIKSIGHATTCEILNISRNSVIIHSLTIPKSWRNGPKRLKILNSEHFSYVWALVHGDLDLKAK